VDDLYTVQLVDDSLSKDEQLEQDAIDSAVHTAYAHEQTRKRQPSSSTAESAVNREEERKERKEDEELIASAIHHALRHSDSRQHVKQMVLHALHRLEEDSAQEVETAKGQGGGDGVKDEKARDVAIVEDEVGRMWRQESVNQTVDELDEAIGRVVEEVKEGGKKIVKAMERTEREQSDNVEAKSGGQLYEVDQEREKGAMVASHSSMLFGVLLGVVLGVLVCGAVMYVLVKQKERHDYDPL
jgi:hypothetical protein